MHEFRDIASEQILLGNLLEAGRGDSEWAGACFSQLRAEHFFEPRHVLLFSTLRSMFDEGAFIDPTTVSSRLMRQNDLMRLGGAPFLYELVESVVLPAFVDSYIKLVLAEYAKRSAEAALIRARARLVSCATADEVAAAVDEEVGMLSDNLSPDEDSSVVTMGEAIIAALERSDPVNPLPESSAPISTGLSDVDAILGGMRPGQLLIVGGRPASGKSTLMMDVARHVALCEEEPVMFFSLEMSNDELGDRGAAAELRIDLSRLRERALQDSDWQQATRRMPRVLDKGHNLLLVESPHLDLPRIKALVRKHGRKRPPRLIVVDYLQLMTGPRSETREQQVAAITRGLKQLARALPSCTLMVGSQLNRSLEGRIDKRPQLADLRESGSVEQDPDAVLLIHRPSAFDETGDKFLTEVFVAKNRQGETGKAGVYANLAQAHHTDMPRFESVASSSGI